MLSRTEGATYVKPWGEGGGRRQGQMTLSVHHSFATILPGPPEPSGHPGPHQEGLVCALTEGRIIWTVHRRLPREVGVKLAHILL